MDLTALGRIAVSRWWVILLAVVMAITISNRLTEYRDDNLPRAEAITWVTFIEDPAALERGKFENFLDTQFALATTVNSDVLNDTPGAFIPWPLAEIDLEFDQNQIQFVGRGANQLEANQLASAMRERFLATSSIGAGRDRINQELTDLTPQIDVLRAKVANALVAIPLTPDEVRKETQRLTLTARVSALSGRYATLGLELLNPVLRPVEAVAEEMQRTLDEIFLLEAEIAAIPIPLTPQQKQAGDLELLLDQLQLQNLEQRWETLYLRERELAALSAEGDVVSQPVTVETPSQSSNLALAVFGTLVATLVGLVVYERARGILWSPSDIEEKPSVFVEMAPRELQMFERPSEQPWYLGAPRGRRKGAVQNLRGQLEDYKHSVVAFQGSGVRQVDVRELAADVAVATAVAGRSVLLIDAGFRGGKEIVEYGGVMGATLARLLSSETKYEDEFHAEFKADFKNALILRPEVIAGLTTLRTGGMDSDAADALAGARFEILLEVAQELFDHVLIAGGDVDDPASHVLGNRVDGVILLGAVGHTVTRSIENAERDLETRKAALSGVVVLRRRRTRFTRWLTGWFRRTLYSVINRLEGLRGRARESV